MRTVLLAALAALTLAAPPAHAAYGLAGEWLLDDGQGVAHDTSGASHDGTLGTGLEAPIWVQGIDGLALHFDGDDEVQMADSVGLEPARLTVEAWVRNTGTPGSYRYVVAKGATACDTSSYGLYTGSSQGLAFYVSGTAGYVVSAQAAPATVWDGAWHHVTGTYDGDTVRLFVDGAEVGTAVAAPPAIVYGLPSKNLRLGTYRGACDLPFTGDVDTVRIWNLALTSDEIAAAPDSPAGRPQPDPQTPRPGTPADATGPAAQAASCLKLSPSRRLVRIGRRTTLTATATRGGRRAARVRVALSAKGMRTLVRRSNRAGRVRFVVRPRRKVTLRLRALGTKPTCRTPVATVHAR